MPRGRQGPGLGLAIADNRRDNQFGIVERSAAGVGEDVAKFSALVNGARRLRRAMAASASRNGKLLEEFEAFEVFTLGGIQLGVCPLQVGRPESAGSAVSRAGKKEHVQVVFLDEPIQ